MGLVLNLANQERRKTLKMVTEGDVAAPGFADAVNLASTGEVGAEDAKAVFVNATVINSVRQIGEFRGLIAGVVGQNLNKCLVLDATCSQVIVVATSEFSDTGLYASILNQMKSERFYATIVAQYIADEPLIAQIKMAAETKAQLAAQASDSRALVVNEATKYLAAYDDIIAYAWNSRASDVHFQLNNFGESEVLLRIFGRLRRWKKFNTQLLSGALTAAYSSRTKSGTNSGGTMSLERATSTVTVNEINKKIVNGRFSGYTLISGYDVVVRLLEADIDAYIPSLEDLGYGQEQVDDLITPALLSNAGLIAISGSTNSGKSTTLRTFMTILPDVDMLKKYALEDPVEYTIPGVRQISIQRSADDNDEVVGLKFWAALRSIMRMDPDVLMIGEIRDRQTALAASQLNLTGHRVLTTVHGNDCAHVLSRLAGEDIGIPADVLASEGYLSAVMYQKLMPVLCPHCKLPATEHYSPAKQEVLKKKYGLDPSKMFTVNPKGCTHCINEDLEIYGIKGQTVVAEIMVPDAQILAAIMVKDWTLVRILWRQSRKFGYAHPSMVGKTAYEHALYKLNCGIIDLKDLETEFMPIENYEVIEISARGVEK